MDLSNDPFWQEAESYVLQFQFDEAEKIYREALRKYPNTPEILESLADVLVQKGDIKQALRIFSIAIKLQPEQGATKYLSIGQLTEGKESIQYYKKGIEILLRELNFKKVSEEIELMNKQLISAYCAIAEVYMTDECYADEAEETCELVLSKALSIDKNNPETLQIYSSFKISQQKPDEALKFLQRSYQIWSPHLDHDPELLPSIEFRIQAAKLFIELEKTQEAAEILESTLNEDDENAEVWYLLGFSLSFFDIDYSLECLTKSRELLVKSNCQIPSIFEQVDTMLEKVKSEIVNRGDEGDNNINYDDEKEEKDEKMDTSE